MYCDATVDDDGMFRRRSTLSSPVLFDPRSSPSSFLQMKASMFATKDMFRSSLSFSVFCLRIHLISVPFSTSFAIRIICGRKLVSEVSVSKMSCLAKERTTGEDQYGFR